MYLLGESACDVHYFLISNGTRPDDASFLNDV